MEPDTIVAAVAQNTVWKIIKTPMGRPLNIPSASARDEGEKNPFMPMIPFQSVPCMTANPNMKKNKLPRTKSIIFFMRMFPVFFALVNPASHMANPACIKYTRNTPSIVHIIFIRRLAAEDISMPAVIKPVKSIINPS